jgi:hypothetical protein
VHSGGRNGKHLSEKNTLVDFDTVFVGLHQCAFGIDLLARGRQPWNELSSVVGKVVNAYKLGEIPGELAIDRVGVPLKETLPRAPAGRNDDVGCAFLFDVALGLTGKLRD